MKTFPTIVLAIFVGLGLVGMLILATYTSLKQGAVGPVVIWGPLSTETMRPVIEALRENDASFDSISYEYVPEATLIPELVAAIAAGRGPDLVFFPASYLIAHSDKLLSISYGSISRRSFQDTFVEAGEVFLAADGIKGLPILIDPLVMYWNRSLFAQAGIAEPPRYWDDLSASAANLSSADERGTLVRSAVAFGAWENVRYAKGILLTLLRQLGNPVVSVTEEGKYDAILQDRDPNTQDSFSADSALRFYTDFGDPVKPMYSWNRSQPDSKSAFLGGTLATYFGRTSELYEIRIANPNLNFDVAAVPAVRGGSSLTEAKVTGLSIPRGAKNPGGALIVAQALTNPAQTLILEEALHVPSVLRAGSGGSPTDAYSTVFRNAAIASFSFLDPDPSASDSVFKRMVENVTSGNLSVSEAVGNASRELDALIGSR